MPDAQFRRRIGAEVRAARTRRSITQAVLADRLGLRRTSVTNIEAGEQGLTLETFVDLAAALGTDPRELLGKALTGPAGPARSDGDPRGHPDGDHVDLWAGSLINKGRAAPRAAPGRR